MSEHDDSHYVKVWAILCGLLAISVIGPLIGIRILTIVTAFGIAIIKASMVARNFMHLNIEKRFVAYLLLAMVGFIVVMFAGMAPDVMVHQGPGWENAAAKAAAHAPAPAHEAEGK